MRPPGGGAAPQLPVVGTALAAAQVLVRAVDAGGMRSIDPSISTDVPAAHVLDDLFEGLTRLDERGEPAPGVATHWETSADGRVWTFHLRAAQWSNGAPVRAGDFVYAWRRTVDPAHRLGLRAGARAGRQRAGDQRRPHARERARDRGAGRAHAARHAQRAHALPAEPADQVLRLSAIRARGPRARRRLGAARIHRQQRRLRAARVRHRRPRDAASATRATGTRRTCGCSGSCTCRSIARCRPRASSPTSSCSPTRSRPSRPRGCARAWAARSSARPTSATSCSGSTCCARRSPAIATCAWR